MDRKMDRKKQILTSIMTAGAFISYNVGAGFASGNELLQFYGSWHLKGIIAAVISGVITTIIACMTLFWLGKVSEAKNSSESYNWIAGPIVGKFFRLFTDILVLGCFMMMFSGVGNLLNEQFHIPAEVGIILLGILTLIVVLGGLKSVETVLGYAGMAILIYITIFAIYTLIGNKSDPSNVALIPDLVKQGKIWQANLFSLYPFSLIPELKNMNSPILEGMLYSTECVISGFPFYITLGKRSKTTKEALASGVVAAVLYYICIIFVLIILSFNMDVLINPATQEMYIFPAVAAIRRLWSAGSWTYSILIFTGIFSSTIGYLWVLSERVFPKQEATRKNKVFIIIMTLLGVALAKKISFSMIINSLFPLAGIAGIGVLIGCFRKIRHYYLIH